jgi:hypothetical protein
MKYLKTYEKIFTFGVPEPGDWVIIDYSSSISSPIDNFVKNNVGQIIGTGFWGYEDVNGNEQEVLTFEIEYFNIPIHLKKHFIAGGSIEVERKNIKSWSKNKEELELIINAEKYNL